MEGTISFITVGLSAPCLSVSKNGLLPFPFFLAAPPPPNTVLPLLTFLAAVSLHSFSVTCIRSFGLCQHSLSRSGSPTKVRLQTALPFRQETNPESTTNTFNSFAAHYTNHGNS